MRSVLPIVSRVLPPARRRSLQARPHFLAYLDEPQTFANVKTREFFSPAGVDVPPVPSYLDTVLSYYVSQRTLVTQRSIGGASSGIA